MKKPTLSLGLSLIITIGLWASRLPAQAPDVTYVSPTPIYPPHIFVVPEVPYEPALHPPYPMPFFPSPLPPPAKHLYRRVLNHFGVGCQENPDGNVGNLHSEARFIFGSSRAFFHEVCVPGQPCFGGR